MLLCNDGRTFLHNVYAISSVDEDPMISKQHLSARTMQKNLGYISKLRRLHVHNVVSGLAFGAVNVSTLLASRSSMNFFSKAAFAI